MKAVATLRVEPLDETFSMELEGRSTPRIAEKLLRLYVARDPSVIWILPDEVPISVIEGGVSSHYLIEFSLVPKYSVRIDMGRMNEEESPPPHRSIKIS